MRYLLLFIFPFLCSCSAEQDDLPLPNILWITSEDNSPFLGCYGDSFATTPNLDRLAARSFLYTHAYANAPVCAPARNTIITGLYANSGGHENMRSFYRKADLVKLYPHYLKEAGYYCTNNQKEDFNIDPDQTKGVWDALGKKAHYKDRPAGKPFFAIFNSGISHESSLHTAVPDDALRHRPENVTLPPYHPDTPEMRHDWAQYYDKIEDMDTWVGTILQELEESGEAENTLIFYYGDHGGVLARSKRYLYESGTRVPFIVHIPEKYKHLYPTAHPGDKVSRIISFVDLVPTLLSLTGIKIPDYLQGRAFLGEQQTAGPEYAFMFRGRMDERYDLSRAVRDSTYRYIRNYMPHRIYAQAINYLFRAPSIRSWENVCKAGKCNDVQRVFWNTKPSEELYDTENDPWEINNLANNPHYKDVLERMRKANQDWILAIKDAGFIPEATLVDHTETIAPYDYMRSGKVVIEDILKAAEYATSTNPDPNILTGYLTSEDPSVRYWGATGLLLAGEKAAPFTEQIKAAANDPSENVLLVASETLYRLGETGAGRASLMKALKSSNSFARTHAMNVIDYVDDNSPEIKKAVIEVVKSAGKFLPGNYDLRMAKALLAKWGEDEKEVGIEISW